MFNIGFGALIGSVFLTEILLVIQETFQANPYGTTFLHNAHFNWYERLDSFTELHAIGQVVYTEYVLQFLIAGNVLLLATVAAVVHIKLTASFLAAAFAPKR